MPRDRHESVLGSGVTIEGKMEGNGDVRIAGKFKGDIHIKGNLNIQKGAHLTVKINAEAVTIEGEVEGTVVASGQVTLSESAQVVGDLKAKTLIVSAGSRMRGNVEFVGTIQMPKFATVEITRPARPSPPETKPASRANFRFAGAVSILGRIET
jgi:cytoskeletal protein CcmA (bactofilin family)